MTSCLLYNVKNGDTFRFTRQRTDGDETEVWHKVKSALYVSQGRQKAVVLVTTQTGEKVWGYEDEQVEIND